jgi:UDP-3-O-[3-hydroxymyristoyl] glucosamine N-acyltransferase
MEFSASQIAALLGGDIVGNPDTKVSRLAKIEEGEVGALTFLANPKYASFIYATKASLAIVGNDFVPEEALPAGLTLIKVADPYSSFALLLDYYNQRKNDKKGIHPSAVIDPSAVLAEEVYVGALVVIGANTKIGKGSKIYAGTTIAEEVTIGSNTTIYQGVKIYDSCRIGDECVIHSGVVIGSDGFGFAPQNSQDYKKVAQIGNVVIGNKVEIGANTTIDRATLGSTRIADGVKLDNLIQIAHNVEIGENTVIAAQTGVAGSTKIGKNCMIGGQVGIVGHITIADEVKIAAQSGIGSSIATPGAIVQGSPAFDIGDYKRAYVGFRKLPDILQRLDKLEKDSKK